MAPGHTRARPSGRACRAALLLALLALAVSSASAEGPEVADTIVKRGRIASDLYAFGGGVDVSAEVNGDLIAGGGRVTVSHTVRGDLIVGAGSVMVGGLVERNVRAAGGAVTFAGRVGRNIDVAGGTITIEPEARIGGSAQLAGGEVHVAGSIGRRLRAAGAVVVLAGEITGNVEVIAQDIEVRPTARLRGKLTYWSPQDARIAPEAMISGRVTHNLPELPSRIARTGTALFTVSRALFLVGLVVAAVGLFLIFPRFTVLAASTIGTHPFKSLGLGLLLVAAIPVLAVLCMITILGIPLGLIIFVVYSLALLLGFVLTAFYLGDVGAQAFMGRNVRRRRVRVVFLVIALGVLLLARHVPVIGGVLIAIAVLWGLGAMSLHGIHECSDTEPPRSA
jgi:cytoskeletal protein CcmA (bactofilin family)